MTSQNDNEEEVATNNCPLHKNYLRMMSVDMWLESMLRKINWPASGEMALSDNARV
jgi:hypothetical protein